MAQTTVGASESANGARFSFMTDEEVMDHPQSMLLDKALQSNIALRNALATERSKIVNRWMDLQQSINVLYDNKSAVGQGLRDANSAICQLLEKKEGNFACRSFISPDPYMDVNDIGVPPYFALRLTYPEDHMFSAVLLKMNDEFLSREEYSHLLYNSGVFTETTASPSGKKVTVVDKERYLQLPLPVVWKPKPLWTAKQVITAVLNHVTKGYAPCIVDNKANIPHASATQKYKEKGGLKKAKTKNHNHLLEADETKFFVWKNELVLGVIDKAQFGQYGLAHTVEELYGSNTACLLLSALGFLFDALLQIKGVAVTCATEDLIIAACKANRIGELKGEDNLDEDKIGQGLKDANSGICPLLEKKESIFRQKMMDG